MRKKAVSLMLAYVLLVVIAIGVSVGVYVWLEAVANVEPSAECPSDASLMIGEYSLDTTEKTISLKVKNNGLFNIEGYDIRGTDKTDGEPIFSLKSTPTENIAIENGRYYFSIQGPGTLRPGETNTYVFSYEPLDELKKIEILPFVFVEDTAILCTNSKIVQSVSEPFCGDGICSGTETCGDTNQEPECNADCGGCEEYCGDGIINLDEECDGENLGGNDCATIGEGYTGGLLGCYPPGHNQECKFDTEACT